jgi:hypothetical protein
MLHAFSFTHSTNNFEKTTRQRIPSFDLDAHVIYLWRILDNQVFLARFTTPGWMAIMGIGFAECFYA